MPWTVRTGRNSAWRTRREDRRRPVGSAWLSSPGSAERLAVWLQDRNTLQPKVGSGLPGPNTLFVAYRIATPGPQHSVAVLQGSSSKHAEAAPANGADCFGHGLGRSGGTGGGRRQGGCQRIVSSMLRCRWAGQAAGAVGSIHSRTGGSKRKGNRQSPNSSPRGIGQQEVPARSVAAGDGGTGGSKRP